MTTDNGLFFLKTELCDRWESLAQHSPHIFRYILPDVSEQRLTDGPFQFLVQLNQDRTNKRRAPQTIQSIRPTFNPDDFNFNKIDAREVLAEITVDELPVSLLINSSPLTRMHTLICPQRAANLPQILTAEAVRFAAQLLHSFGKPGWRIGYNSPGAWASVNHLHLHLLHRPERMYVDTLALKHLRGPLYQLDGDRPVDAFAFRLQNMTNLSRLGADVMRLVSFLCDRDIPHNLFFTLGNNDDGGELLRIVVFPKAQTSAAKEFSSFNIAFCELSGYVPLGSAVLYAALTEAEIVSKMRADVGDVCQRIAAEVTQLYSEDPDNTETL